MIALVTTGTILADFHTTASRARICTKLLAAAPGYKGFYPGEVAGMVLVDPMNEDMTSEFTITQTLSGRPSFFSFRHWARLEAAQPLHQVHFTRDHSLRLGPQRSAEGCMSTQSRNVLFSAK